MKNIYKRKLLIRAVLLAAVDGLFFGLTDPNKINSLFLLVGFILFGLSFYVFIQIIMSFLAKIGFKIKNRRKLALFIDGLAILLLALQSIGQLSARDVLIILPLVALLYIYSAYIRPKTLA